MVHLYPRDAQVTASPARSIQLISSQPLTIRFIFTHVFALFNHPSKIKRMVQTLKLSMYFNGWPLVYCP